MIKFRNLLAHGHRISLGQVDPLGGGLAEEIIAEQREPGAIVLEEGLEGDRLSEQWGQIVEEAEKDPDWFSFANEE